MKLIDGDKLIEKLNRMSDAAYERYTRLNDVNSFDASYAFRKVIYILKHMMPVELEIVHCKECKYYEYILYQYSQFEYGECAMHDACSVNPDDFCSKGERKANGTTTT